MFDLVFQESLVCKAVVGLDGRFLGVNRAFCAWLGYTEAELLSKTFRDITHPDDLAPTAAALQPVMSGQQRTTSIEKRYLHKNGGVVWGLVNTVMICDEAGQPLYRVSEAQDITERKRVERELCEAEERFHALSESSATVVYILEDGLCRYINPAGLELLGYTLEELLGVPLLQYIHPDDRELVSEMMRRRLSGDVNRTEYELRLVRKDGSICWMRIYGAVAEIQAKRVLMGNAVDITERRQAQEQVKKSLAEKEALLQELYHRTRNNMNVMIALLQMQAERITDEKFRKVLLETQNRIYSMALVHERLYVTQDLSRVNLKHYVQSLAAQLADNYGVLPEQVAFVFETEEVLTLLDTAIPCGLILNELISNALLHAFPSGAPGQITIELARPQSGGILLGVRDNGVGFPGVFQMERDSRLGLQTVRALACSQLGGEISLNTAGGFACQVHFQDRFVQPRV